jgi:hypothetical protein
MEKLVERSWCIEWSNTKKEHEVSQSEIANVLTFLHDSDKSENAKLGRNRSVG